MWRRQLAQVSVLEAEPRLKFFQADQDEMLQRTDTTNKGRDKHIRLHKSLEYAQEVYLIRWASMRIQLPILLNSDAITLPPFTQRLASANLTKFEEWASI